MLAALAAYQFLLGIGISSGYPDGSVAVSKATSETRKEHRHALLVGIQLRKRKNIIIVNVYRQMAFQIPSYMNHEGIQYSF